MSLKFSPTCALEHPQCHLGVDVGLCGADVSAMCLPDVCKGPDQSLVPLLSWPYQHFPASPEVSSRHLCSLSSIEALPGKHTKSLQKQGHFALVLLLHGNIKPHLYGCGYVSVTVQHTTKL